jgi:hypothetical protein
MNIRTIPCERCQTEGRILTNDGGPYDVDHGECPVCQGAGCHEIEVQPIEMSDLECPPSWDRGSVTDLLRDEDLKIEIWRPGPPGGQHVGTDRGLKVTHLPSGLIAVCDNERSQHRNKSIALDMILGGLTSKHFR